MKYSIIISVLILLTSLISTSCQKTIEGDIIIKNVNIVDVENGIITPSQDVIILGEKIDHIEKHTEKTNYKAAKIVDGSGKFMIPGLWDMHVHLFDDGYPNLWKLKLMAAYGITGVREMYILPNEQVDTVKSWNESIQNGSRFIPRIGAIGTLVDGNPPIFNSVDTVTSKEDAREIVSKLKSAGVDFVKTYDHLSKDAFDALILEAENSGLYVAGHIPKSVSIEYASKAGIKSIEHLTGLNIACSHKEDSIRVDYLSSNYNTIRLDIESSQEFMNSYDIEKTEQLISTLAENKTWAVPTLVLLKNWMLAETTQEIEDRFDLKYIPKAEYADWQMMRDYKQYAPIEYQKSKIPFYQQQQNLLLQMQRNGVPILAGTDAGVPYIFPGLSLIEELQEMVDAGFTNIEALQTATLNPSIYFNRTDELGTVAEGKLADFVILEANPLDDIGNLKSIYATSINGYFQNREELNGLLREVRTMVENRN